MNCPIAVNGATEGAFSMVLLHVRGGYFQKLNSSSIVINLNITYILVPNKLLKKKKSMKADIWNCSIQFHSISAKAGALDDVACACAY